MPRLCFAAAVALTAALFPWTGQAVADGPVAVAREEFDAHRYREARRVLEPAVDDAAPAEARLLMAGICNRLADWRCSLEHAEAAVAALPRSSAAQYEYALALRHKMSDVSKIKAMFSLGDYKKALARAIELDAGNVDAREEEIGFLIHSPGFAGRDLDKARVRIGELEKVDWPRAMMMRAELEEEEGDSAEAERVYREVLERHPEHDPTHLSYGFFCLGKERYRDAAEQFAAVREEAEPRYRLAALYQLGRSRVLGGFEAAEAVGLFDRYIESADDGLDLPSRSDAYWRQGMAYEQLGRTDDAKAAYRRALALEDGHKQAKKALRALGG